VGDAGQAVARRRFPAELPGDLLRFAFQGVRIAGVDVVELEFDDRIYGLTRKLWVVVRLDREDRTLDLEADDFQLVDHDFAGFVLVDDRPVTGAVGGPGLDGARLSHQREQEECCGHEDRRSRRRLSHPAIIGEALNRGQAKN
jgi:hypothetical protein